jgi:hypothetical protein
MEDFSKEAYLTVLRQYSSLEGAMPEFLHDLRNRASGILIASNLLKEHPENPLSAQDYHESVDWIERYAHDIAMMIEALQEYDQQKHP